MLGPVLDLIVAPTLLAAATPAGAEEVAPANTLQELRSQVTSCLAKSPISASSRVTIMFSLRRDGSIFGKPRITFSHLEGDAATRGRFLDEAERAVDSCLPLKVTPALGGAIAGRLFTITLGRLKQKGRI